MQWSFFDHLGFRGPFFSSQTFPRSSALLTCKPLVDDLALTGTLIAPHVSKLAVRTFNLNARGEDMSSKQPSKTRKSLPSSQAKVDSASEQTEQHPIVSSQAAGGIAGATIGGMVAGPVGALIGGVAGAVISSPKTTGESMPSNPSVKRTSPKAERRKSSPAATRKSTNEKKSAQRKTKTESSSASRSRSH